MQNLTKCRMEDKRVNKKISLRPCFVIPLEEAHSPNLWGAQDKKLPINSSDSLNPHVYQKANYLLLLSWFFRGLGGFFWLFFFKFYFTRCSAQTCIQKSANNSSHFSSQPSWKSNKGCQQQEKIQCNNPPSKPARPLLEKPFHQISFTLHSAGFTKTYLFALIKKKKKGTNFRKLETVLTTDSWI